LRRAAKRIEIGRSSPTYCLFDKLLALAPPAPASSPLSSPQLQCSSPLLPPDPRCPAPPFSVLRPGRGLRAPGLAAPPRLWTLDITHGVRDMTHSHLPRTRNQRARWGACVPAARRSPSRPSPATWAAGAGGRRQQGTRKRRTGPRFAVLKRV
jgi:hypothetical protein